MAEAPAGDRLLLDTHVFIWWRTRSRPLSERIIEQVGDADAVFVSLASAWEMAIKTASGKLQAPSSVYEAIVESGFTPLPITFDHVGLVASLPLHHRDPFDRMLAAQAIHEGLTLVTHDRQFAPYALPVLWT